jgi:hypothetical protein
VNSSKGIFTPEQNQDDTADDRLSRVDPVLSVIIPFTEQDTATRKNRKSDNRESKCGKPSMVRFCHNFLLVISLNG